MLKRILLCIISVFVFLSGCCHSAPEENEYTLRLPLYTDLTCRNPHDHFSTKDYSPLALCEMGFVRPGCLDSDPAWIYEMAVDIEDVTASFSERAALGITDTSGRVFRISLNPDAVWEDGTSIPADTYLHSMQLLLDSSLPDGRSLPFYSGPAAILNAAEFAQRGTPRYEPIVPYHSPGVPAEYPQDLSNQEVYLHLTTRSMTLSDAYSVVDLLHEGYVEESVYLSLEKQANAYGYILLTDENKEDMISLAKDVLAFFGLPYSEDSFAEMLFRNTGKNWPDIPFSEVGLRKSGLFELIYITESVISMDDFLGVMSDNWLVDPSIYEIAPALYGTSVESYRSYGPYRLEQIEESGSVFLMRNEKWYGFRKSQSSPSCVPDRVQFIKTETDNCLSLWEHGRLDLCPVEEDDPAVQNYDTFLQSCPDCGKSFLRSPKLISVLHCCSRKCLPICNVEFHYNDWEWDVYCLRRNGYAVLPTIQKTP